MMSVAGALDSRAVRMRGDRREDADDAPVQDRGDGLLHVRAVRGERTPGRGVVCADHEDDDLGMKAIEFTIFDPPDDVLGLVATDAEVRMGTVAYDAGGDKATPSQEVARHRRVTRRHNGLGADM